MKLTIILIIVTCINANATIFAQKISLNDRNVSLEKVFQQITEQSGYHFFYEKDILNDAPNISINVKNESVTNILNMCFRNLPYRFLISGNTIGINKDTEITADKITSPVSIMISGRVTDSLGNPISGVTVFLKDTKLGTVTDNNGNYTLTVPQEQGIIVFTYIGYDNREIQFNKNSRILNVILSIKANNLNEVVIVGYGAQRKRDVTGAVTSISGKSLQEVPAQANVADQLQGKVAGLDISTSGNAPGAIGQIRLRGQRSFSTSSTVADATNGPLFVLDGVPLINASLNDINPNDIQNVEVLKDASATAIYGSRASGGVILVTTKRGKSGITVINFNTSTGLSKSIGHYDMMDAQQYVAFKNESIAGNSIDSGSTAYPLTVSEQDGIDNGTNTQWTNLLLRTGVTSDNQIQFLGGNEKTQFSLSGGYHDEKGIEYAQGYKRGTLQFTLDNTISKVFKVGITSNSNISYTNNAGDYTEAAAWISPLLSPYNDDGSVNVRPWTGSVDELTRLNPLTLRNKYIQDVTRRLVTNDVVYGEANILEGLKFRVNASLSYNQSRGNIYFPVNTITNTNTTQEQSTASVSNSDNSVWVIENLISYDRTFKGKHHIMFTGLWSAEKDHTQASGIEATGVPADYLQSYNLYLANTASVSGTDFSYAERGLLSYMARAFYGFNDKYMITATVRRDGSSVLGPGHQYFTYPAFAFGWNVDRENFMKNITWVNALKFRAGYGVTADQNISPYQILGNLSAVAYNFGSAGANGYLVSTLPNSQLKFEHTNNVNIGLDFAVLNNRLTGSIDAYIQRTYNILQVESLPISNGASSTTVNAGSSKGKGLEINLSSKNIDRVFKWSTDFNISFQRYSIVSLHDGLQEDIGNGWFVGQPFDVIYDYRKIGIWQTDEAAQAAQYNEKPGMIKVQDLNKDGMIDANDRQILGSYQPDYIAGITNRLSYKGFDLTFVAFAKMGQKVAVNYLDKAGGFFNIGRTNEYNINYWTPNNPTNDFPRPDASGIPLYASTLQYRDGSFIKMRTISLAYNLPASLLKKGPVKSLRITATVNNPFSLYAPLVSQGLAIDPETNTYGGQDGGASGFSGGALGRSLTLGLTVPSSRVWLIGINAGF